MAVAVPVYALGGREKDEQTRSEEQLTKMLAHAPPWLRFWGLSDPIRYYGNRVLSIPWGIAAGSQ